MSYLDRLDMHWRHTIKVAVDGGASDLQVKALESLAESEFGYRSSMRLKPLCFWDTKVDKDGDVALHFVAPWVLGDDGTPRQGERVSVFIDHLGVLTMKNMNTGEQSIYDPHEEHRRWKERYADAFLIWALDDKMLKPFTEPGLVDVGGALLLVETGQVLSPFIAKDKVQPCWSTMYYDGPIAGYVRVHSKLHYYQEVYEEEVDGTRVYALHQLSGWQAFKGIANSYLWHLELKLNRLLGWPTTRTRPWKKLPRFNTKDESSGPIVWYTTLSEIAKGPKLIETSGVMT